MESIKYGDIVVVDLNPTKDKEISKIRPCLVVSNNILNKKSPFLIVIPMTSSTQKSISWHVIMKKSKSNKLKNDSKIIPEQVRSISKKRAIKKLGSLEANYLSELEKKLAFILNQKSFY